MAIGHAVDAGIDQAQASRRMNRALVKTMTTAANVVPSPLSSPSMSRVVVDLPAPFGPKNR